MLRRHAPAAVSGNTSTAPTARKRRGPARPQCAAPTPCAAEAVERRLLMAAFLTIDNVVIPEGNAGNTPANFTVTLHQPVAGQTVTVNYLLTGTPADVQPASGTLTFAPGGPTTQSIPVSVVADTLQELTETFSITLSNPTNATVAGQPGTGYIVDDDTSFLTIHHVLVAEGNAGAAGPAAVFTVTRSGSLAGTSTVQYQTNASSAQSGVDFTNTAGVLTFAPGVATQTISVPIVGDTLQESNEIFTVTLDSASNTTFNNSSATGTIVDDDASSFVIDTVAVEEGDGGTTNAVLTVTRYGSRAGAASVNYETVNNTAVAGQDFTGTTGAQTLNFAPGVATQQITIPIIGDTQQEGDERFFVDLAVTTNSNATIAQGRGEVYIPPNDAASFTVEGGVVAEGDTGTTPLVFTVRRVGSLAGTATVNYTAPNSADYQPVNGSVTFAPGEASKPIAVQVIGDTESEADQTFNLTISLPQPGANGTVQVGTAQGIIFDDDESYITIVGTNVHVVEGDSGTRPAVFTVHRFGSLDGEATVNYATSGGSPGADYTAATGTLRFLPGEASKEVRVDVIGDTASEQIESFVVNLSLVNNADIVDPSAQAWIVNDDAPVGTVYLITDAAVLEGDSGTTPATFTVRRLGNTSGTGSVQYTLAAPTDGDYESTGNPVTLNFAAGETEKTVTINVVGDGRDENHENYNVNIGTAQNGTIADATGRLTIVDDDDVIVYVPDATTAEGDDPAGHDVRLTVRRFGDLGAASTFNFATSNAGATAGQDYQQNSGILTFAPGDDAEDLVFRVLGDTTAEGAYEQFRVDLTPAANANGTIVGGNASVTIIEDDAATFFVNDVIVLEGTGATGPTARFVVTRFGPTAGTATVNYETTPSTATVGQDYTARTGTLAFGPGVSTQSIDVPVVADGIQEPFEQFLVDLSGATNATIMRGRAFGRIVDDDQSYVGITGVTVQEGDGGTQNAVLTLTRFGSTGGTSTVGLDTNPSTATTPADFEDVDTTVTFAPGETSKAVPVSVVNDTLQEQNEQFSALLGATQNTTTVGPNAVVYIIDNDASSFFINNPAVTEGSPAAPGSAVFTVTRVGSLAGPSTIHYETANGSATQAGDYATRSGSLTFAPNVSTMTITVPLTADDLREGEEYFNVNLSAIAGETNGTIVDTQGRAVLIDDDEVPAVAAVYVNGTAWNDVFRSALADASPGSSLEGYAPGGGAGQLGVVPWTGVNQIRIVFTQDVIVDQSDLQVRGSGGTVYAFSNFQYVAARRIAIWTLAQPGVATDKLLLHLDADAPDGVRNAGGEYLDGEWSNGSDAFPSGNTIGGGDFRYRVNVLGGDPTRDQSVNALDLADVRRRLGRQPNDGVTGAGAYNPFADMTADGRINALDLAAVRQRLGRRINNLPEPTALASAGGSSLFSENAVAESDRLAALFA